MYTSFSHILLQNVIAAKFWYVIEARFYMLIFFNIPCDEKQKQIRGSHFPVFYYVYVSVDFYPYILESIHW